MTGPDANAAFTHHAMGVYHALVADIDPTRPARWVTMLAPDTERPDALRTALEQFPAAREEDPPRVLRFCSPAERYADEA